MVILLVVVKWCNYRVTAKVTILIKDEFIGMREYNLTCNL